MKAATKRKVSKAIKSGAPALTEFNIMDHLTSPDLIAAYISEALNSGDDAYIRIALGNAAKAVGMSKIAVDAKMNRESLYKALATDGNPSFSTVLRVIGAMGVKLSAASMTVKGGVSAVASTPRRRAQAA